MKIAIIVLAIILLIPIIKRLMGQAAGGSKFKNIGADEFAALAKDKNTVVIDVRSPGETAQGKIPGAKEMNLMGPGFKQQIAKLDKTKTYLVYCRSGNRSATACGMMAAEGLENLYNLSGGYSAWERKR